MGSTDIVIVMGAFIIAFCFYMLTIDRLAWWLKLTISIVIVATLLCVMTVVFDHIDSHSPATKAIIIKPNYQSVGYPQYND